MRTYLAPVLLALALTPAALAAPITYTGTGLAGTTAARDAFRLALGGGTLPGANGSFGGVRREINWDGVPDSVASPNSLPANFFNSTSPRGAVFSGPGTGFQVSANAGVSPVEFGTLDPSYTATFTPFSAQRLFAPIGSNITDVTFFIPGTTTPGLTTGFASVFSDVDLAVATSIEYFGPLNESLGKFFVPNIDASNETLQFLGVDFGAPIISRVRITTGTSPLGAGLTDTLARDVVAMDDFIYAEPIGGGVPEPASLSLLALGATALLAKRRRA